MTEVTGVYITIHKELAYELGNIIRMIFPQFPSELYWRTFKEAQNWCLENNSEAEIDVYDLPEDGVVGSTIAIGGQQLSFIKREDGYYLEVFIDITDEDWSDTFYELNMHAIPYKVESFLERDVYS